MLGLLRARIGPSPQRPYVAASCTKYMQLLPSTFIVCVSCLPSEFPLLCFFPSCLPSLRMPAFWMRCGACSPQALQTEPTAVLNSALVWPNHMVLMATHGSRRDLRFHRVRSPSLLLAVQSLCVVVCRCVSCRCVSLCVVVCRCVSLCVVSLCAVVCRCVLLRAS